MFLPYIFTIYLLKLWFQTEQQDHQPADKLYLQIFLSLQSGQQTLNRQTHRDRDVIQR